jgi:hypothetical protein
MTDLLRPILGLVRMRQPIRNLAWIRRMIRDSADLRQVRCPR